MQRVSRIQTSTGTLVAAVGLVARAALCGAASRRLAAARVPVRRAASMSMTTSAGAVTKPIIAMAQMCATNGVCVRTHAGAVHAPPPRGAHSVPACGPVREASDRSGPARVWLRRRRGKHAALPRPVCRGQGKGGAHAPAARVLACLR